MSGSPMKWRRVSIWPGNLSHWFWVRFLFFNRLGALISMASAVRYEQSKPVQIQGSTQQESKENFNERSNSW